MASYIYLNVRSSCKLLPDDPIRRGRLTSWYICPIIAKGNIIEGIEAKE
jgi:hypothetical protein